MTSCEAPLAQMQSPPLHLQPNAILLNKDTKAYWKKENLDNGRGAYKDRIVWDKHIFPRLLRLLLLLNLEKLRRLP